MGAIEAILLVHFKPSIGSDSSLWAQPKLGADLLAAVDFDPYSANRDRIIGSWRCDLAVNLISRGN